MEEQSIKIIWINIWLEFRRLLGTFLLKAFIRVTPKTDIATLKWIAQMPIDNEIKL